MSVAKLERLRNAYGPGRSREKLALLRKLARRRLASAKEVARLHEMLCFLCAYPDDARVLAAARRMLAGFARRADLRRHRDALENSGIAGTGTRFPYFWPSARWLARRWPRRITLDRLDRAADRAIGTIFGWKSGFAALDRLRPRGMTDAAYFVRLVEAMPGDGFAQEAFYDSIEPMIELHPAPGTPSRTLALHRTGPITWQRAPLDRSRPDLAAEMRRAPRAVRRVAPGQGARLLELARVAMATRERDLDAFAYGDPHNVRLVHDRAGLAFSLNGVIPERRGKRAAIHGAITLKNGVPIGYIQIDVTGRSAELSFNTFPTFRDGEAARIFVRALAMVRHVFGARSFSIEPYQLGKGNHEALDSGAWWFYYKLGFRPRAREARALARRETARTRRNPAHRSDERTLLRLAEHHLYLEVAR